MASVMKKTGPSANKPISPDAAATDTAQGDVTAAAIPASVVRPAKALAEPLPSSGGSYHRNADGTLTAIETQ